MIRFSRLKGMEVLADKEGKMVGSVRRILIDSKHKSMVGLVFKGGSLAGEHWATVKSIKRLGEDVIFLADMRSVEEDIPPGRDIKDLLGLPVTSLDGKHLGMLDDIVVDPESWAIASLVLEHGKEVAVMEEAVFGEDTLLLQKGAQEQLVASRGGSGGFLSRVFHSTPPEEPPSQPKKRTPRSRKG